MSIQSNPFVRGYQNLRIVRTLCITYEDDSPPVWRLLHSSQAHLPDDQVAQFPCIFCNDFALITEGQEISEELEDQCQTEGIVRTVTYAVAGDDFGQPVHVGDTYSDEAAREVIRRLTFDTGFYSRCWEISSAHITEDAGRYLAELAASDELERAWSLCPGPRNPALLLGHLLSDGERRAIAGLDLAGVKPVHAARVALFASSHQRAKKATSPYANRRAGSAASAATTESSTGATPAT